MFLFLFQKDKVYLAEKDINNTKINGGEGELWKLKNGCGEAGAGSRFIVTFCDFR
ncbi:MAG: hypothetical protein K6U04_11320 [Armatimonadetes bacterium]|nr:hypothetical protein [Armatimonadota bacterium]